jgi:small subunit ribosomal protein S27Ae
VAKARIGLYLVKGDALTRTHKSCPKCGAGTFLAEHSNRRSCGHCGYSESKSAPAAAAAPKPTVAAPKPKAPKPA